VRSAPAGGAHCSLTALLGMIPLATNIFWGPIAIHHHGGACSWRRFSRVLVVAGALSALWFQGARTSNEPAALPAAGESDALHGRLEHIGCRGRVIGTSRWPGSSASKGRAVERAFVPATPIYLALPGI